MNIRMAKKIPGSKIMAEIENGSIMVLKHQFSDRDCPMLLQTLTRIREAGRINLSHWRDARTGEY